MKKLLFAIGIMLITLPVLNAGQNIDSTLRIIGFNIYHANSVSGYGIILGSIDNKFQNELHHTMGGRKNDYGMATRFGFSYYIFKSTR